MPLDIFKASSFSALIWVVLPSYMSFGIALWYSVVWQQTLRHTSVLRTGINFIPLGVASLIGVFLAALLVSRVPAQWIMAVGVLGAAFPCHSTVRILPRFCPRSCTCHRKQ
jgi:hypothetical protein